MTATVLMIRHAAHGQLGDCLSGRTPGLPLSGEGRAQLGGLAALVRRLAPDRVQTSPVRRARETAAALAPGAEIVDALDEVDFGDWTGRRFDALEADPAWRHWNEARATAAAPGGESMAQAQARAVAHVDAEATRGGTVAMVSHCDIVRAVVAHHLGLSLDRILSFAVDVASVTTLEVGAWGGRIVRLNEVAA